MIHFDDEYRNAHSTYYSLKVPWVDHQDWRVNEAGEEREVTACDGRDIMKEEEDDREALRQLAHSNVKTLSDGEMMNRERELQWLWLPLRRIGGVFFIYIKFYTFIFQLFLNQLCVKVATFLCFKSHEFLVSLKISASPGVSS